MASLGGSGVQLGSGNGGSGRVLHLRRPHHATAAGSRAQIRRRFRILAPPREARQAACHLDLLGWIQVWKGTFPTGMKFVHLKEMLGALYPPTLPTVVNQTFAKGIPS